APRVGPLWRAETQWSDRRLRKRNAAKHRDAILLSPRHFSIGGRRHRIHRSLSWVLVLALRHAFHVDAGGVAPGAEGVDSLPEVRQRGQAQIVHTGALAPYAPRRWMASAGLGEPAVAFLALTLTHQELSEPEHRVRGHDVLGERRQVRTCLPGVEG